MRRKTDMIALEKVMVGVEIVLTGTRQVQYIAWVDQVRTMAVLVVQCTKGTMDHHMIESKAMNMEGIGSRCLPFFYVFFLLLKVFFLKKCLVYTCQVVFIFGVSSTAL